jgi:hypothetical protein
MFKKLFVFLAIVMVIAIATLPTITAFAWYLGVSATSSCVNGVAHWTVTANPENPYNDGQHIWTLDSVTGTGTGTFGASETSHPYTVTVKWIKNGGNGNGNQHFESQSGTIAKPTCHVECAIGNQVAQPKVYGATVDVPPPFAFGPWVDNNDGTFSRTGTMNTSTPWTQAYDDNVTGKVCKIVEGSDSGTRPYIETKTPDPYQYAVDNNDCKGWSVTRYSYIDGVLVKTEVGFQTGVWTDPTNPNEIADTLAGTITKNATCYIPCAKTTDLAPVVTYSDWSPWVFNSSTGQDDSFRTVTTTVTTVDYYDNGHVCGEPKVTTDTEWRHQPAGHNAVIDVQNGCPGWSASFSSSDGGNGTPTTPTSGVWVDPFTTEHATVSYHVVWPDGYSTDISKTVDEPDTCLEYKVAGVKYQKTGCGPKGSTYTFTFPDKGVKQVELTKGPKIIILTQSGSITLSNGTWDGKVIPADGYEIVPSGNALFTIKSKVCPGYVQPKPVGLTLWIFKDHSAGFNLTPGNFGPDTGCFIITTVHWDDKTQKWVADPISPSYQIPRLCDLGSAGYPGDGSMQLVFAGPVFLPDPTHQVWGYGGEGDSILAKLNHTYGWRLTYRWLFPGFGGH